MANDRTPRLGAFIEPEVTDARIARQWAGVEQRLPEGASQSRWLRAAMLGTPLIAALALLWLWVAPHAAPGTDSLVESAESPVALRLHDGSSVELDAHTRLQVVREQASAVDLALASGSARFDVTHVPGRTFNVSLGAALVTVVGTRFEVARVQRAEGTLVRVEVTRGVVEVRRRDQSGGVRRLSAGETWSALLPSTPSKLLPSEPAASASAPSVQPQASAEAEPEQDVAELDGELVDDHASADVDDTATASHKRNASAQARALFQRANLARRAGQMQDAANAYAELLQRHSRDARAGLSAFELGRIRMDALSDPKGAVKAFSAAVVLSPTASFREDALARIVVAYDTMGLRGQCKKARNKYLSGYPQGVHVASLAARCD